MKEDTKPEMPDMGRYPFRGIYAEIAREEGISRQAVKDAADRGDPDILARIAAKVEERKSILRTYKDAFTSH
jgi:hypothetical protein